jgi:hypothetical protein
MKTCRIYLEKGDNWKVFNHLRMCQIYRNILHPTVTSKDPKITDIRAQMNKFCILYNGKGHKHHIAKDYGQKGTGLIINNRFRKNNRKFRNSNKKRYIGAFRNKNRNKFRNK